MATTTKCIHLQGFATLDLGDEAITLILLNQQGKAIGERDPLRILYTDIRQKQVFEMVIGTTPVKFIDVVVAYNEALFAKLKYLTHSDNPATVNWITTPRVEFTLMLAGKTAPHPPLKNMKSLEFSLENRDGNDNLISIEHIARPA